MFMPLILSHSLNHLLQAPSIVNEISWAETIWPEMLPEDCPFSKPQVSKYCLMGVKDSYTDFHADFGGTSVWYHVMRVGVVTITFVCTKQHLITSYVTWMSPEHFLDVFTVQPNSIWLDFDWWYCIQNLFWKNMKTMNFVRNARKLLL